MSDHINRTSISTVIFVGIVDYARLPVEDQIALKERFNALINKAVREVPQNDRIILDTGEGAALALLGAPEDALAVALNIREGVVRDGEDHPDRALSVRIGINLGPVRVVSDINGRRNVVGDGINAAQRVMSFAQPGSILVSRSYYDIASRLSAELAGMFYPLGAMADKFDREHEVYRVRTGSDDEWQEAAAADPRSTGFEVPAWLSAWRSWRLPVAATLVAFALAGGYYVAKPAMPESATQALIPAEKMATAGQDVEQASETGGKPDTAQSSSPTRQAKRSSSPSSSKSRAAKPHLNPLCSDAQRMLKQC